MRSGNDPTLRVALAMLLAIFIFPIGAWAQEHLKGRVDDEKGDAIAGAVVRFVPESAQTSVTANTDVEGRFQLDLASTEDGKLVVQANGFRATERKLNVSDIGSDINFTLVPTPLSAEVTVTRTESRIEDNPASIVVLSSEELNTTAAASLDDKLRQVPGFSLFRRSGSRTANPTTQGVSLRGIGPSGASRALVLWDGVPLNDPFGGWVYWGRVPAESIADVEVLRGSASDLYGNSAIGGVVAVSRKGFTSDPAGSLQLSYGTMNTPNASGDFSAGFDKWRGSLSAEAYRTDGYIPVAEEARGPVDTVANVRYLTLAPEVGYEFGRGRRVFVSGNYYREERANGTPLQSNDTVIRNVVAGADIGSKRFGDLKLRAYLTSQNYNQSFTSIAADRLRETLLRLQRVPAQVIGFNAVWSKELGKRFSIFSGTDGREIRGRSDETVFTNSRASSLVSAGGRDLSLGAYAGGSIVLSSRAVLSGGLRVDHWRDFAGYSSTRSLVTGATGVTHFADRSETAVSPRVSLLVRVDPNLSISATFSTGFRQPTLNELYRSFRVGDALTLANEALTAERALDGEAGAIYSAFGRKLFLRGNFFCTQISDPVANVTLSVTPTLITRQRQNLGSLRSCGIEADWETILPANLKFSGGYLFVEPRVTSFPANTSLEGLLVPQVARQQFSMQFQYSDPKTATIALQFRAASSQFDDDQNQLRLARYATFDLYAQHRFNRNVSVFAAVENLFNTRIEAGRTPILTLGAPRFVRAGIRLELSRK